ncbi:MAG TPA: WxL domain-containing protein [Solirubrobacteraceae bacterium]|nr:WxL domain-containing protein [Solirubrobacteraceae bacterium]
MTSTRPTITLHRAIAVAIVGAALVSLFLLLTAKAEANNDKTYFTVTAGALEFATAPALPSSLTGVTLNGEAQNTHTNMTNFKVKDARGTGVGWHVSVSSAKTVGTTVSEKFKEYCESASVCGANEAHHYVTGGKELEANSLTLNSTAATFTPSDANVPTYTVECNAGCTIDTPEGSPHKVVSAAVNKGMGSYETVFSNAEPHGLMLATPMNLATLPNANEVYRVDVVWTLATLP